MDGSPTGASSGELDVTIVCNVFNEETRIPGLFEMLEQQQMDDLHVVFVDDGSTDRTLDVISDYDGLIEVDVIALDHVGLAPARERGLSAVKDGVAVVVDADMGFDEGWLRAIRRLFEDDPGIGGSYSRVAWSGDQWLARGGQAVREVVYWVRGRSGRPWMVGHGMAIRSHAYHTLGFSADDFTAEDLELSERFADAGWRVVPLDEPAIRTEDPATLAGVWRRHLLVGRRTAHLTRRQPRFLLRASNVGRFFPAILLGVGLVNRRAAVATEIAATGALVWIMRQCDVAGRDLVPGLAVFHIQTTASLAGLVLETARIVSGKRRR